MKIALAGNPNSGKSCLFNALTGLNQKTGNFPGVTIDKRTGICSITQPDGSRYRAEIIDLPGLYGMSPGSDDEKIAFDILSNSKSENFPDLVILTIDASKLKRGLFLCTELLDRGIEMVIALNMGDIAEKKGIFTDKNKLAAELGIPVVCINAKKQTGIDDLLTVIKSYIPVKPTPFLKPSDLENSTTNTTILRYRKISTIIENCTIVKPNSSFLWTTAIDKVITHPFWGYLIFLGILFLIFQSIFSWAAYPMNLIDTAFLQLRIFIKETFPSGVLTSLLAEGIVPGIGGIVMFIPQIAFLFFFITLLEDSGYLARVSFIMDRVMRKFGLNGRSVIPLISGAACAIPAIMSTRIIKNWKERLISIFIIPLVSCSARLPVFILIISLIVPEDKEVWFLNMQGLLLMALYLTGLIAALLTAFVMKWFIRSKESSYFIMELPDYNFPDWKTVCLTILEKIKVFTFDAGKVILAISIILWVLASNGPGDDFSKIDVKYSQLPSARIQSEKLAASYAGILGKKIEPILKPLGFDWKIGIAIITSFAAREVFVGTMATIYSVGDINNAQTMRGRMLSEINPETGMPRYNFATCLSLLLFYAFALQCMSTIAVVYRESKHWKWPVIQLVTLTGLAYLSGLLAYQLFS